MNDYSLNGDMETTESWLIHIQPKGETSCYLYLFTKSHGLIRALFKGAKKRAHLQIFRKYWVNISHKNQYYYVNSIEQTDPFLDFKGIYLCSAQYINELIYYLLRYPEPDGLLYQNYEHVLIALSNLNIDSISNARFMLEYYLRNFELKLLIHIGIDTHVIDRTGSRLEPNEFYSLVPDMGWDKVGQDKGYLGQHLIDFFEDNQWNEDIRVIAKKTMRQLIDFALQGKDLQSRQYLALFRK